MEGMGAGRAKLPGRPLTGPGPAGHLRAAALPQETQDESAELVGPLQHERVAGTHSHISRAARPGEVLLDVPGRVDLGGYLVEAAFGPLQPALEFEDFHH